MTRRAAGESLPDDDVVSSNSDLLPELQDELSLLSMMERARLSAQSASVHLDAGRRPPAAADIQRLLEVRGFAIERELHRGGQGVVFEAVQRSTRRRVAIKVLHESDVADPRAAARFEREARILAMINHPHVVKVLDTGVIAGRRYIAMDLIRGIPWTAYEQNAAAVRGSDAMPDVRGCLERFARICDAVNAAHLRGIIHRDLKPGNILVDDAGAPHVLDFGLAKLSEAAEAGTMTMTRDGQFVGSLPWAAPEQATGHAELFDVRGDVYALGVVLYQVLTGTFPYPVEGAWRDVARTIADVPPAPPRRRRPDLDTDVEKIVLKSLAKRPEERYQSMDQFASDVRRYLTGQPVMARGGSALYVLRRLARRHRIAVMTAACFILFLAGAAITTTTLYRRERAALAHADLARRQSESEASKASAVVAFLRDMLAAADPAREGKDVKVIDLLDGAASALDEAKMLRDKPLAEAAVRQTIGETYCGLGMPAAGEQQFRAALQLQMDHEFQVSADRIQTMHALATSLWMLGRLAEAQAMVEDAMAAIGINLDSEITDEPSAELLGLHNLISSARGDFARTIPNAQRRYDYYERTLGRGDWRTVYALSDLSYAYDCNGRIEEAADICREALGLARAARGPDDPLTLNIATNLATALGRLKRYDEADPILHDVLAARRRTLPPDHPAIAAALTEWARVLGSRGDANGARQAAHEALAIQLKAIGPAHASTIATRLGLADLYLKGNNNAEAEAQLTAAFDALQETWCEHRALADTLANLRRDLYRRDHRDDALVEWEVQVSSLNCPED